MPINMISKQQEFFLQPTKQDILCGRGRAHVRHPGNQRFAKLIRSHAQQYVDAPRRVERSVLVASLVQKIVDEGCRFLTEDKRTTGTWKEMSIDQTHEKVGHAIRDLLKKRKVQPIKSKSITYKAAYKTKHHRPKQEFEGVSTTTSTTKRTLDPIHKIFANPVSEDESEEMHDYPTTIESSSTNITRIDSSLKSDRYRNRPSFRACKDFDIIENRHDLTNEEITMAIFQF